VRRLLAYVRDFAVEQKCHIIVSTHSSVAIDFLSHDANTQIVHVQHDGTKASLRRATTYVDNCGVLDDLDVRASDLLQANCVLWVEGPSDRILVNRWIEIWTERRLIEGLHYQCVFYGGRLLAHLSASENGRAGDAVEILRVNRHAILMMDSDLRAADGKVNTTKMRMKREIESCGGLVWVTAGKEIENYLLGKIVASALKLSDVRDVGQFEDFATYLDALGDGMGGRYKDDKVTFAAKVAAAFPQDRSLKCLDLAERLDEICERIRAWNKPFETGRGDGDAPRQQA
jgi:hypothetical protein